MAWRKGVKIRLVQIRSHPSNKPASSAHGGRWIHTQHLGKCVKVLWIDKRLKFVNRQISKLISNVAISLCRIKPGQQSQSTFWFQHPTKGNLRSQRAYSGIWVWSVQNEQYSSYVGWKIVVIQFPFLCYRLSVYLITWSEPTQNKLTLRLKN